MPLSDALDDALRQADYFVDRAKAVAFAGAETGPLGMVGGSSMALARQTQLTHHGEQYRHYTGWPYSIIRIIAQRIAGQPVRVGRNVTASAKKRPEGLSVKAPALKRTLPVHLKMQAEEIEVLDDHPFIQTLRRPNPIMVQWAMIYVTIASLELTGKAHWWFFINDEGQLEIWPLPSSWVLPLHDEKGLYYAWEIRPEGLAAPMIVPGPDIVLLGYPDPSNPLNHVSPLQANARAVIADEAVEDAQRRSFGNGIHPGLALVIGRHPDATTTGPGTRPILDKAQRAQLIAAVKQQYRGVVNYDEPLILDGLIEDAKRITMGPRELDFLNSAALLKERLTQGWGVNPVSMGQLEGANRASSATADDHLCLRGDALVYTDRGVVEIRHVRVGDRVMTGDGAFDTVAATICRDYSGPMSRLWVKGLTGAAVATPEHPFWVLRDGVRSYVKAADVKRGDCLALPASPGVGLASIRVADYADVVEIEGEAISVGYRKAKRRLPAIMPLTSEFGWALGFYLAEGNVSATAGIVFSCHKDEAEEVAERIDPFLSLVGAPILKWYDQKAGLGTQGITRHKTLADLLDAVCGKGARGKRVPSFVFDANEEFIDAVLAGYFYGDGNAYGRNVSAVTVSESLALGIQLLLCRRGFAPSNATYTNKPHAIDGRMLSGGKFNRVAVNSGSERLASLIGVSITDKAKTSRATYINDGEYVWYPVEAVETEQYEGEVYNLTMSNIHSYVTQFGVSSNCGNVINPKIVLISQTLTVAVQRIYNDDSLLAYIEEAHAVDPDYELAVETAMVDRAAMDRNEWRARHHLPPIKNGDSVFIGGMEIILERGDDTPGGIRAKSLHCLAQKIGRGGFKALWLKNHNRYERQLVRALRDVIKGFGQEAVQQIEAMGASGTVSSAVVTGLNLDNWEAKLKEAAEPLIMASALTGATTEWELFVPRRSTGEIAWKALPPGLSSLAQALPAEVQRAVEAFAESLLGQPFWTDVVKNVREDIAASIRTAVEQGESGQEAAARISRLLGTNGSTARAFRIARTEVTGALNAGHEATRDKLAKVGLLKGKKWLSIVDDDTREEHKRANGQQVGPGEEFTVGGERATYPGDVRLSAGQRCNCRCTSISVTALDDED